MAKVIRLALPTYNALTDTNPNHFSLFSGEDDILIKEHSRGSISVGGGDDETITHSLGYVPFYAVYGDNEWIYGYNPYSDFRVAVTTTTIILYNVGVSAKTFKYYIFYDKQI